VATIFARRWTGVSFRLDSTNGIGYYSKKIGKKGM